MPLDLNRQRTFVSEVLIALMMDMSSLNTYSGFQADCAELITRIEGEGLPFVTSTLPSLGKALETALECGCLTVPVGFGTSRRNPGLPCFLQEVLLHIFHGDGTLRPDLAWIDVVVESGDEAAIGAIKTATEAVKFVRQLCYLGYKLELPRDEELDHQFVENWESTDRELPEPDDLSEPGYLEVTRREFRRLLKRVSAWAIRPKHGPGAVATGERGDQKWAFKRHHDSLASLYDLTYFTVGGEREMADRPEWTRRMMSSGSALKLGPCSKMLLVHKDSRGPRVICEEELELMFIQQGLANEVKRVVEWGSRGRIQFRDQSINGRLALRSSLTRRFATLDLKDASDRVSLWAIRKVASEWFLPFLEATRSKHVMLPNGKLYRNMRKYAPMGSALCFPIEATLFYCIAVAAIASRLPGRLRWIRSSVHVYGDDLIVPREYAAVVIEALETWALKVNRHKSFIHGFFRESCGVDAFAGANVTPIKLKKLVPSSGSSVSELASLARTAALLQAVGYVRAGEIAYREVEEHVGSLPFGVFSSGYLCRVAKCPTAAEFSNRKLVGERRLKERWNNDLQRLEWKALSVHNVKAKTALGGWERLLRNLLTDVGDSPDMVVDLNQPSFMSRTWCAL